MTAIRITVTGIIKNAGHRQVGDKTITEFSLCRKNRTKEGDPDSFTWVKGLVWEAPEWMCAKLVKGAEVTAMNGEATLRSYNKAGVEKVSLEAKFSSFDIQIHGAKEEAPAATPVPRRPAADVGGGTGDEGPPFAQRGEWE